MLRVCMVAYTHYPTDARVRREAEALIERGDTVDVICLGEKGELNPEYKNSVRMIKIFLPRYRGSNSGMYIASYLYFFWAAMLKLIRLQLKYSYQVIQVHTMPDFMVFTTIIPKLLGAKVILDVHDLMPELYQSKFSSRGRDTLIHFITWVERCSIRFADRAIAVSKPHLNTLIKHGNPEGKFIIFLNLPDTKFSSNRTQAVSRKGGGFKIIYHGLVSRQYELDVVIQVLATIKKKIEGLEFRIIGQGEELPLISKLVNDLSMHDYVTIQDWLPPEEFIPMILDSDVGIVPLSDNASTKHAIPVKLLEYVALGKPVISSRTEAIQAYFDDSMIQYFTPGSIEELTENIYHLYKNPDMREQLIRNADRFNREYSWEKQKLLYFQMIDQLINPNLKERA
jgi:glycosyltransferase involved in cell wall biosynthesis